MKIFRTRFGKDIVAEVALPTRRPRRGERAIIFCSGMPSMPSKRDLLRFWSRKGFVCILPRYRGAWESGGHFLEKAPYEDVKEILDRLARPLVDAWSGEVHQLRIQRTFVIGSSFGGAAALLVSADPRVDRVVALSPVVDWRAESKAEPFLWMTKVIPRAFGGAYRLRKKNDWRKLLKKDFFNPIDRADRLPGEKTLIFHAKDDEVVDFRSVVAFARRARSTLHLVKRGGHFSTFDSVSPGRYRRIARFLRTGYTDRKSR